VIDRVQSWLDAKEIREVVDWSHHVLAHSADQVSHQDVDLTSIAPTMDNVASAQWHLVRATEAISTFLLRGPVHGSIVPVVQYSQFHGVDWGISAEALEKAESCWTNLVQERDHWTSDVWDVLVDRHSN
jgi:hypothetical protein